MTRDDLMTEYGAASWDKQMCLMEIVGEKAWNLDVKRGPLTFGGGVTFREASRQRSGRRRDLALGLGQRSKPSAAGDCRRVPADASLTAAFDDLGRLKEFTATLTADSLKGQPETVSKANRSRCRQKSPGGSSRRERQVWRRSANRTVCENALQRRPSYSSARSTGYPEGRAVGVCAHRPAVHGGD